MPNIVVIGAGVSGLTTALLLSKNPRYKVTIVAKHMPGDYDIEYTSPWAGANYLPMSDSANCKYEKNTWPELARLARDVPEAGIHFQNVLSYNRSKDPPAYSGPLKSEMHLSSPWFKDTVPNFRILDNRDLPLGYDSGTAWTSVCLNLAIYLPWLISQCLKNGVVLKRAVLNHISEAAKLHTYGKADVIVNCTGILASKLGGVMDTHVVPARGVTVVVRNSPGGDMFTTSGTDDGDDQPCYIMERAAGGGTILGGTYQKGNWESQSTQEQAIKIMKRCVDICPALTGGKGIEALSVIRVGIGLRPLRLSGVRIEREKIGDDWVVHNYGHAGWGYQASYGCSETVRELVDSVLIPKARL